MTEKEKRDHGDIYNPNNDEELQQEMLKAKDLCCDYNMIRPSRKDLRQEALVGLLGQLGDGSSIIPPFWCDYGYNIQLGENVFLNHNCTILDGARVEFGDDIFVGPDCGFYTAGHPVDVKSRKEGLEYARPIKIENHVWIGGGVRVMPGVTIGEGSIIGGGSVVIRDIPSGVLAAGNPCRVIRPLTEEERESRDNPLVSDLISDLFSDLDILEEPNYTEVKQEVALEPDEPDYLTGNPRKPEGEDGAKMLDRMNRSHEPVTEWALDFLRTDGAYTLLDIGCGGGATIGRLADRVPGARVTGVDYSPISVKESSNYNADLIREERAEVIEASVEDLPFRDGSFDRITTVESFYFWPDPEENLKEVFRVLKPGGQFLLIADIYGKAGLDPETLRNIELYDLFNPSKEEFHILFRNAGFTAVRIHVKEGTDWICVEGLK